MSLPSTTPCGGLRWDARDPGRVGGFSYSRAPTSAGSQDSVPQAGRSGSKQPAPGRGLGLAELSRVSLPAQLLLRTELAACEGSGLAWNLESTSFPGLWIEEVRTLKLPQYRAAWLRLCIFCQVPTPGHLPGPLASWQWRFSHQLQLGLLCVVI